jgi:NhaP-type Na+/H+ or K+/H+ antiporter
VSDERVPSRIRQGLNVESGLNDGLCVPLFFIALAIANAEETPLTAGGALRLVGEEIGYGVVGGALAGLAGVLALRQALRRSSVETSWLQILTASTALLAAATATALGGSMFIAAFVAGFLFGVRRRGEGGDVSRFVDEGGELLSAATFLVFGAAILGPVLGELTWQLALYAVLSLTVVRMLPVWLALLRSGARLPTVAFVGWFGPRGIASIVFGVLLYEQSDLPGERALLLATTFTIALSVLAHGITARPLTDRYARWYATRSSGGRPMETVDVRTLPVRFERRENV